MTDASQRNGNATSPAVVARISQAMRMAFSSRSYLGWSCKLVAGCVTKEGRRRFAKAFRGLSLPHVSRIDYPTWLARRLADRRDQYPIPDDAPGFSFLTCVYDTKASYVRRLAETVFAQTIEDFEWIVLDNGSSAPETLEVIEELGRDPRVVSLRIDDNAGIVGGMRRCLEAATRQDVVPLDSDDLLTPDALQILAHVLTAEGLPALAYSDEDKVRSDDIPFEAYFKPDWDPVLFWNQVYIAHLCAIDREKCLEDGVYSDDGAKGCHDWDTFFRFLQKGHTPAHAREVLYSWRMHPASCAGNIHSKSYIHHSQSHVLERNLRMTPGNEAFTVEDSPLFPGTPDWWVKRRHADAAPMAALHVGMAKRRAGHELVVHDEYWDPNGERDFAAAVAACRAALPAGAERVAVLFDGTTPCDDEWAWEATGLFERFADAGVVGGRIYSPDGLIWFAGQIFGFSGIAGMPDRGRHPDDPGYFAQLKKQRSVSAVSGLFCVVRIDVLEAFAARGIAWSRHLFGAWLGAEARGMGLRAIYTPFFEGEIQDPALLDDAQPTEEAAEFHALWHEFSPDDALYSPSMSLTCFEPYGAALPETRERDWRAAMTTWGIEEP